MSQKTASRTLSRRGGLYELAHGEALRFIAATVGGVPDYRAERRTLVKKARELRLAAVCADTSKPGSSL